MTQDTSRPRSPWRWGVQSQGHSPLHRPKEAPTWVRRPPRLPPPRQWSGHGGGGLQLRCPRPASQGQGDRANPEAPGQLPRDKGPCPALNGHRLGGGGSEARMGEGSRARTGPPVWGARHRGRGQLPDRIMFPAAGRAQPGARRPGSLSTDVLAIKSTGAVIDRVITTWERGGGGFPQPPWARAPGDVSPDTCTSTASAGPTRRGICVRPDVRSHRSPLSP